MKNQFLRISLLTILLTIAFLHSANAAWIFDEINWSPGGSYENDYIYQISWRPQGDYALIAAGDGIYRYNHDSETLEYLDLGSRKARAVQWSQSGDYALISDLSEIYRYDHSESGFGTISTITDIQGSATLTFYEVVFNPDAGDPLAYITTNKANSSSSHQLVIYRYDPAASPQIYADYSGGTTYAISSEFGGMSAVFQADGDYIVISNKLGNGYSEGIFVFDPDQSTFPKEVSGAMQWFPRSSYLGNTCAVTMGKAPDQRFVLVKGSGYVQRAIQSGLPASFNTWDQPGPSPSMTTWMGDGDYSYDGNLGIVVERGNHSPYHRIGTFDENGDAVAGVDLIGLPVQRSIRLNAVAWHPSTHTGLIGGEERWLIHFTNTSFPTPTPSPTVTPLPVTPEPTNTPPAVPLSQAGNPWFIFLVLSFSIILVSSRLK